MASDNHEPIVDLDQDLRDVYPRMFCDRCNSYEHIRAFESAGEHDRVVAFDTYAELQQHRRNAHLRASEPIDEKPPIEVQLSFPVDEGSDVYREAELSDIEAWADDLQTYLNKDEQERVFMNIYNPSHNLRPLD
jgi:hypothetical protein